MDPTYEIIRECIIRMKADPEITAFVEDRIYDRVPEAQDGTVATTVKSPYISLGSTTLQSDDYDCIDATTISLQWHCWSFGDGEAYSSVTVRKLASLVRKSLRKMEVNLANNALVSVEHVLTVFNRASDGVTQQASLTFEVLIDIV